MSVSFSARHLSVLALVLFSAVNAFASAKVTIDSQTNTVTVSSHIYFFGAAATAEAVKAATDEINQYWNGGVHLNESVLPLQAKIDGKNYAFKMVTTSEIVPMNEVEELWNDASPDMNFIEIQKGNSAAGDRSSMNGICSNNGLWFVSDDLGKSTTAAHEFGHGLCLNHPQPDWRGKGQPPVMAARGEYVDAAFQYDPNALPGKPGGTMNPFLRRVIQFDIDSLPLEFIQYDRKGVGYLKMKTRYNAIAASISERVY